MQTSTTRYSHTPGQIPQPTVEGTERATRPRNIPAAEWPENPRHAVPELRFDDQGNELPRYRATELCQREDVLCGRLIDVGGEFYHEGPPSHYMEPVNQAAIDMSMRHPAGAYVNPIELLPI